MSNTLTWSNGLWTYKLEPVSYNWQFTGTLSRGDKNPPLVSDFGIIPGGAYTEIERLVKLSMDKSK